jgi:hypothetical protein
LEPLLGEVVSAQLAQLGPIAVQVALQAAAPGPLLHAVRSAALQVDQPRQLHALLDALPERSLLFAQTSLEVLQHTVVLTRRAAAADRDAYLPGLAMSVNNLATRLAEAGRRSEGLAAAQEAVEFNRELAGLNRDVYLPGLAGSVHNLAIRLAEAGRRADGLAAAQEAVDLRRELAGLNRDAYLPALAMSVHNLAFYLVEASRRSEGLAAAQEAVDLYRELAQAEPELYGSAADLAAELVALLAE